MLTPKDYSKKNMEELEAEEKKLKSQKVFIALLIGFLIGLSVWSATHKGGFLLTIVLIVIAFLIGKRHSQTMKNIQTEISRRKSAGTDL